LIIFTFFSFISIGNPKPAKTDEPPQQAGAIIDEDLSGCDLIVGVKEVPVDQLIADKTYMFVLGAFVWLGCQCRR
jgi:hypothetical protein